MPSVRNLFKNKVAVVCLIIISIFICDYFGIILHFLEVDYSKFIYPLEVPIQDILTSIRKKEDLSVKPINEYNFSYKIPSKDKCLLLNGVHEKVVILYVIKSALGNLKQRNAIRETWGRENRFSDVIIRRIFIIGVSESISVQYDIDEEYMKYKDLVQADFIDSYYNNTVKTMMGFKWVISNCPKAQFIMFSDDDMYVSTKNLLKFIRNPFNQKIGFRKRRDVYNIDYYTNAAEHGLPRSTTDGLIYKSRRILESDPIQSAFDGRLYAGYVFNSSPMRHKSSKWYITLSEYPFSRYPPYVTAGAYVLSYPALEDMYYTSLFTKYFKFDDVYLGIVARKCGIVPLHNENFYFWKKSYYKDTYSDVIASHGFHNPVELKSVWYEQQSAGHA